MPEKTVAIVNVESSWISKINWTAIVTMVATLLSIWAIPFPPELQNAVVTVITVGGPLLIVVFRTFFNKTVTPESVASSPVVAPAGEPVATPTTTILTDAKVVDAAKP